jgi:hypothetical protein
MIQAHQFGLPGSSPSSIKVADDQHASDRAVTPPQSPKISLDRHAIPAPAFLAPSFNLHGGQGDFSMQ